MRANLLRLGILLAALTADVRLRAAQPTPGPVKILLGPTVSAPSDASVNIWWQASRKSKDHSVEFGPTARLGRVAQWKPEPHRFVSNGNGNGKANGNGNGQATMYPYVELTGLSPGSTCFYRVRTEDALSEVCSFQLPAPGAPVRTILWADNQGGYDVFKEKTVPLVKKLHPNLILIAGDLVDMGFMPTHWSRDLYGPARELLRTVPWFPVRGNHDGDFPLAQAMLPLPDNNFWYARTCATVRWVILDTNLDYSQRSPQVEWLTKETQSKEWREAALRVVSFHHPPFNTIQSSKNDDGSKLGRDVLVPILESAGADLVVSGHAHVYERGVRRRTDGKPITYLVCGGGGGDLDDIKTGDWPFIKVTMQRHHVVSADIIDGVLKAKVIDAESHLPLDEFEIVGGPLPAPVAR